MSNLETRAVVVKIVGQHALVQSEQGNGCAQCNGKGCGAVKLAGLFCRKPRQFNVVNPINARIGDEVVVSVASGSVLRGIGLFYLMPLILLFAGAIVGTRLVSETGQGDAYGAAGALIGLAAGFGLAKWVSLRLADRSIQPYISRLCSD